jgi:hypothetical protein
MIILPMAMQLTVSVYCCLKTCRNWPCLSPSLLITTKFILTVNCGVPMVHIYREPAGSSYSVGPLLRALPGDDKLEIIYHVSNFDDLHGGILEAPQIGDYKKMFKAKERAVIFESFLLGALFITGMLYISFYMNKRDDRSSLFFGFFCPCHGPADYPLW